MGLIPRHMVYANCYLAGTQTYNVPHLCRISLLKATGYIHACTSHTYVIHMQ